MFIWCPMGPKNTRLGDRRSGSSSQTQSSSLSLWPSSVEWKCCHLSHQPAHYLPAPAQWASWAFSPLGSLLRCYLFRETFTDQGPPPPPQCEVTSPFVHRPSCLPLFSHCRMWPLKRHFSTYSFSSPQELLCLTSVCALHLEQHRACRGNRAKEQVVFSTCIVVS